MTKQISIELYLDILCTFCSYFNPKNSKFKKKKLNFCTFYSFFHPKISEFKKKNLNY